MRKRRTKKEIREIIERLKSKRAGSIFTWEFEAGMLYIALWILNEEPELKTRADAIAFRERNYPHNLDKVQKNECS